jgi:hypothetical protein
MSKTRRCDTTYGAPGTNLQPCRYNKVKILPLDKLERLTRENLFSGPIISRALKLFLRSLLAGSGVGTGVAVLLNRSTSWLVNRKRSSW